MEYVYNDILYTVTSDYLQTIDPQNPPKPVVIEKSILDKLTNTILVVNSTRTNTKMGDSRLPIPKTLPPAVIAMILMRLFPICKIDVSDGTLDLLSDRLAIYQSTGPNEGLYVTDEQIFTKLIMTYNFSASLNAVQQCINILFTQAPRRQRTLDPDLVAVNNGIFNYKTKELLPFSPDYVFLAKSTVDYDPLAENPIIHNDEDGTDWDVETWMSELSDDPDVVNLLWEIIGAVLRPNVHWNKSAWFFSEHGNNGKGTLCKLMRNLCGINSCASIPLSEMGKDFALSQLFNASAIIVDENDVGTYIDKAANLKAIITGDIITVNRKYKDPISMSFHGFMIQCLNEKPRLRDKSDSFFRRQIFVPFEKCFTGVERPYIKNDYLQRPEVLRYVLKRVLHMDYYKLSIPERCVQALEEYKEYNDPVRQFVNEILPLCTWEVLPFQFLFDLYKSWFKENLPSGIIQNKASFINDLKNILPGSKWQFVPNNGQIRTTGRKFPCEPLIARYNLTTWENPLSQGTPSTIEQRCTPAPGQILAKVRGILNVNYDEQDDLTSVETEDIPDNIPVE